MTPFRQGRLSRHASCRDIDVYVVRITYRGPTYIKARVKYWNRHSKFFHFEQPETVTIQRSQFHLWSILEE